MEVRGAGSRDSSNAGTESFLWLPAGGKNCSTDVINCVEFEKFFVILPWVSFWDMDEFITGSAEKLGKRCEAGGFYNNGANEVFLTVNE